jgi:F420H(2)-dependent quinone reductase
LTFTLDAEVAAVLQAALEKNGPPPAPPVGDVQTRRTALNAMLSHGRVGGNVAGAPLRFLHTVAARRGQRRINPAMYLADGDRYLVCGSHPQ